MKLIDADKLIEFLDSERKSGLTLHDFSMVGSYKNAINFVEKMPTAYDVEKVVAELEDKLLSSSDAHAEAITGMCGASANVYYGEKSAYTSAIEIVKQGGVSDDVCEWRLCDEEANVYDTSCRNPHILIEGTPKENNYEYCPYCGKKIKVVE